MKGFLDKIVRFQIICAIVTKGYLYLYGFVGHCQCAAYGLQWRFMVVLVKYTQKYSSEDSIFHFFHLQGTKPLRGSPALTLNPWSGFVSVSFRFDFLTITILKFYFKEKGFSVHDLIAIHIPSLLFFWLRYTMLDIMKNATLT